LTELVEGHEPGYYIYLGRDEVSFKMCLAGEDLKTGDICQTDEELTLPIRHAHYLKPTGINLDAAARDESTIHPDE